VSDLSDRQRPSESGVEAPNARRLVLAEHVLTLAPDTNISSSSPRWSGNPGRWLRVLGTVTERGGRGIRGELAEQGRAEQDTGQDLADHLGWRNRANSCPSRLAPSTSNSSAKVSEPNSLVDMKLLSCVPGRGEGAGDSNRAAGGGRPAARAGGYEADTSG
jgi:hypothetical protein